MIRGQRKLFDSRNSVLRIFFHGAHSFIDYQFLSCHGMMRHLGLMVYFSVYRINWAFGLLLFLLSQILELGTVESSLVMILNIKFCNASLLIVWGMVLSLISWICFIHKRASIWEVFLVMSMNWRVFVLHVELRVSFPVKLFNLNKLIWRTDPLE